MRPLQIDNLVDGFPEDDVVGLNTCINTQPVGGDWGCGVGEVQAYATSPIPDQKAVC